MSLTRTIRALLGDRVAAAENRFTASNRAKRAAGCQCGKPATDVRYHGGNVGSVAVEFWTCAEHVGVGSWDGVEGPDGKITWTPQWERVTPCDTCIGKCSTGGPIGGPTTRWYCPIRPEGATIVARP